MVDVLLSTKPLQKLTGTGGQAGGGCWVVIGEQDHVLSQADALTKNFFTLFRILYYFIWTSSITKNGDSSLMVWTKDIL